jgi:hypothetical protein
MQKARLLASIWLAVVLRLYLNVSCLCGKLQTLKNQKATPGDHGCSATGHPLCMAVVLRLWLLTNTGTTPKAELLKAYTCNNRAAALPGCRAAPAPAPLPLL